MLSESNYVSVLSLSKEDILPVMLGDGNRDDVHIYNGRTYDANLDIQNAIANNAVVFDMATLNPTALTGASYTGKDVIGVWTSDTGLSKTVSAASISGLNSFTIYGMVVTNTNLATRPLSAVCNITVQGDCGLIRLKYGEFNLNVVAGDSGVLTNFPIISNVHITINQNISTINYNTSGRCASASVINTQQSWSVSGSGDMFYNVALFCNPATITFASSGLFANWINVWSYGIGGSITMNGPGGMHPTNYFHKCRIKDAGGGNPLILASTLARDTSGGTCYTSVATGISGSSVANPIGWIIDIRPLSYKPYDSSIQVYGTNTSNLSALSASTSAMDAIITQKKTTIRGSYGNIRRQYYNLQFNANHIMPDGLKYFDDSDYILVNRSDIKLALSAASAASAYHLMFVDSQLNEIAFRWDESFFLYLSNGCVLGYIAGKLRFTVLTQQRYNEFATVLGCFQIWETPEDLEYRNIYDQDNMPISASITMQDYTSKAVI